MHSIRLAYATMFAMVSQAAASDPLTSLVPVQAGASACFQRVYDENHLKQHPRQQVLSVLVSLKRAATLSDEVVLRMRVEVKGRAGAGLFGGWCAWRDKGANSGESTARLVPNFPRVAGIQCQHLSQWGTSSEDASLFPVDLDPAGKSLTLYLRSKLGLWTGQYTPEPPSLALGADDRVFRLDRADSARCAALDGAIPDPPGAE